jgi:hypothetical protein
MAKRERIIFRGRKPGGNLRKSCSRSGARRGVLEGRFADMFNAKKPLALEDAATLLNTRRLPARLHSSEVAGVLGFQEHDIPVLVIARLLIPLGKPAPNAPKYFALVDVLAAGVGPRVVGPSHPGTHQVLEGQELTQTGRRCGGRRSRKNLIHQAF